MKLTSFVFSLNDRTFFLTFCLIFSEIDTATLGFSFSEVESTSKANVVLDLHLRRVKRGVLLMDQEGGERAK